MNSKYLKKESQYMEKFNSTFKPGDKVMWRGSEFEPYKEMTVSGESVIANSGTAVVFFDEIRGYCSVDPLFVKY